MHHAGRVGGDQRTPDLLDELTDAPERPRAAGDHRVARRPSAQQPEHQVRAPRLSPVVVERHDVRVLEAGDEAGLGLEAADEVGRVGEIGADDLDRDASLGAWLGRGVDPAVAAFPDRLVDDVAAQRSTERAVAGGLEAPRDRPLQPDEVGRGIEPGLVGETGPVRPERPQRLGLTARREQRVHQQAHGTFAQGMLDDETLEFRDRPPVVPDRHQRMGVLLACDRTQLGESCRFRHRPPLAGELAERVGAVPQRQRPVVALDRPIGQHRFGRRDQLLEVVHVASMLAHN